MSEQNTSIIISTKIPAAMPNNISSLFKTSLSATPYSKT
jgi:hypothetical protein